MDWGRSVESITIDGLMCQVAPIIRAQLRGQPREDAVEMEAETVFRLVRRFKYGVNGDQFTFAGFCSYVKTVAQHVRWDLGEKARYETPFSTILQAKDEELGFAPDLNDIILDPTTIPDPCDEPEQTAALRQQVRVLWTEILLLPSRQRLALLLFLRDRNGGSALRYWLDLGKSRTELAGALGIAESDLPNLLEQLPLDDNAIGNRMGLTRTEVCTLRVAARKRLQRRTKLWF